MARRSELGIVARRGLIARNTSVAGFVAELSRQKAISSHRQAAAVNPRMDRKEQVATWIVTRDKPSSNGTSKSRDSPLSALTSWVRRGISVRKALMQRKMTWA